MITVNKLPETPEELEQLLNDTVQQTLEMAMRMLPGLLNQLITQAAHAKQLRDDFYTSNKDLDTHKDLTAKTLEQLQADNPGSTFEDLLKRLGPEVRKRIGKADSLSAKIEKPSLDKLDHLAGML